MSTSARTSHRTLHVVDLENLVGDPRASGAVAHDTLHRYLDAAGRSNSSTAGPRTSA
jgi:hypothetical protein